MPRSGSRNAVIFLKCIRDVLILRMAIFNGYSVHVLVFCRVYVERGWMLHLKNISYPFGCAIQLCFCLGCLLFFPIRDCSTGVTNRESSVAQCNSRKRKRKNTSFSNSECPSFLKLGGHTTAELVFILPFYYISRSNVRLVGDSLQDVYFSFQTALLATEAIKISWVSKCRTLLRAFTKYLILVGAYLRIQGEITYPYL